MNKFSLALFGWFILMGVGILVMIFGWGLEPRSWGWILFGNTIGAIVASLFKLDEG